MTFFFENHHVPHIPQLLQVPTQKNIILITIDTLRQDRLGCYGHPEKTTPAIDYYASRGVEFGLAIANSSWTIASMPAISCSQLPSVHRAIYWGMEIDTSLPSIPLVVKKYGYKTAFFGVLIPHIPGFEKGFDNFKTLPPSEKDKKITLLAQKWLRNKSDAPFFLWLHYLSPHAPYKPKRIYKKAVSQQSDRKINAYEGEVKMADDQIGLMKKFLHMNSLDENTAIIISTDHGEILLERSDRQFDHGKYLYDELLHIPLIIYCPWLKFTKKIVDEQVQSLDIAPTILDLLDFPQERFFQGKSLLPLANGMESPTPEYIVSSVVDDEQGANRDHRFSLRSDMWKLIYLFQTKEWEVYNLENDPGEKENLGHHPPHEAQNLQEKLKSQIPASPNKEIPATLNFNDDEREKLKSLGYLD